MPLSENYEPIQRLGGKFLQQRAQKRPKTLIRYRRLSPGLIGYKSYQCSGHLVQKFPFFTTEVWSLKVNL